MQSLAWLAVLVPILGIAVIVVFIVAVIQEGKSERRSFKQAFFVIVSLVMLGITVGSSIALLSTTFTNYAFPSAKEYQRRFNSPPALYLTGLTTTETPDGVTQKMVGAPQTTPYACTTECQFTDADKTAVTNWKTSYTQWRDENTGSLLFRRDLAVILPFLIVALPLFIIFFRLMQKGAAAEMTETKKISPIRSLYFYFIAFGGLLIAVFGAGGTINIGLNSLLKTSTDINGSVSEPFPASYDNGGVKSLIACADKCDFTAEETALANQWLTDAKDFAERQNKTTGKTANDLSIYLPLLLVGIPLFWYHFARIRKETQDLHTATPSTQTPAAS